MRILVKFPTRERPEKFLKTMHGYLELCDDPTRISYLVSIDDDDRRMQAVREVLDQYPTVNVYSGISGTKIKAINRDMYKAPAWDILVLASDDMICQAKGWDTILRMEMATHFPDTDGTLFHWDGDPATRKHNDGKGLCTMCIMGKKYYDRFGYIYHPEYVSLWCDNEYTEVAQQLGKMYFSEEVLFKHEHHSNTPTIKPDSLMQCTQSYYNWDNGIYMKRRAINFGI